jgi:phage terminase small subunit
VRAASAALPFVHQKIGEGGKKDAKGAAAKAAGQGKFGTSAPPKLVVNNRG